jgi:hypothetical protein
MEGNDSTTESGESSRNKVVLHRLKHNPTGKETSDVEDDRRQLLGDDNKPRQRTADEIKAAYGHAKALVRSAPGL